MANEIGRSGRFGGFSGPASVELKPLMRQPAPAGTLVIKLKTPPSTLKRFAAAVRGTALAEVAAPVPVIESLIANGYISDASPVFPTTVPFAGPTRATRALAAAVVDAPSHRKRSRGLVTLSVAPGTNVRQLADHLASKTDEVEYAYVPPVKYYFVAVRSAARKKKAKGDPLFTRQWAHGAVKILAARLQSGFVESRLVPVAVVDSGVDNTHPDLDGAVAAYENFLSSFEDNRDAVGHGTHVSGIIGAERNNAVGVAGLCASPIYVYKGLPRSGVAWNAEAYYHALARPMDTGAKVLNLSLGGGFDPGEQDIIRDLLDAGVTVVAAMGNEYQRGNPVEYPSAYDGVIAVGATDEMDRRGSFSNTGKHIAIAAPGVRILSTVPRYPSEDAPNTTDYDSWDGTSMATPHVVAAAALVLAKRPGMTPAQVRKRLMDTADRLPGHAGWSEEFGAGRLNIDAALRGL